MDSSSQFNLSTLLAWVTACSCFLATTMWARSSSMLGTPEDIPLAYIFGFPLMGFGLIVVPFLCFACLLAILGISLGNRRISISSLMFLGYSGFAILASGWPALKLWQSNARILALMAICAIVCILETHFGKLPNWHWWVAALAVITTFGYFLHLAASVACIAA